jgi:hypothetical protein
MFRFGAPWQVRLLQGIHCSGKSRNRVLSVEAKTSSCSSSTYRQILPSSLPIPPTPISRFFHGRSAQFSSFLPFGVLRQLYSRATMVLNVFRVLGKA